MAANLIEPVIDWRNIDYRAITTERIGRLMRLRRNPHLLPSLLAFYRDNPAQFLDDWGCVQEPRHAAVDLPTEIPLKLWPRQWELIAWIMERWRAGEPGVITKSRDSGVSWLTVCLGATLCLFYPGVVIGYASRKVELVDGTPKSLFTKARFFLSRLPREFLGGLELDRHFAFMRGVFPNGSVMSGEGGEQIGRGDRTSLHFVDEAAFLPDEAAVDAALSQTTRSRIDVSTPHGRTGSFAGKHFSGKIPTFIFTWRDNPLRTEEWYQQQVDTLPAHVVAQEIDCSFDASVEGILIPSVWVQAAVDAHIKLGIEITGDKFAGYDIADTGDRCAVALRHGILVTHLESWSGSGSDLFSSTVRAIGIFEQHGHEHFSYDGDGLGASVAGDAAQINQARHAADKPYIREMSYRGSAAVNDPTGELVTGRKNQDFFLNAKSQAWWWLRSKFEATYRAVVQGVKPPDPDALISIPSDLPELRELLAELSQPVFKLNQAGKVVVDKHAGGRSPDRADALVIAFEPSTQWLTIWTRLAR